MSDGKKASFFQRLLGIGDQPAEPAKKDPPQDSPKRDRPPEGPLKKDPPLDRPAKQEPPRPKGPARAARPKAPPPAGPAAPPHDTPPDERPPSDRKKKSAEEKAAPSVFEPKTPRQKEPKPGTARPAPPPAGPHVKPKAAAEPTRSWFDQLRHGLARTSNVLSDNLASALTKRKLDEDTLDRIEEVLIKADLGVAMAARIRSAIARGRYDRGLDANTVRDIVAGEIAGVLDPVASDFALAPGASPHVFLVVGVNGSGKTTTEAKMAYEFSR